MSADNVVDLVKAVAWPLAVVIGVVALMAALPELLRDLGRRTTRISVFQFAVELAPPAPLSGQPALTVNLFNEPIADPSYLPHLFQQLLVSTPADYMVVDLRNGQSWLTSRLFIWAEMLHRVRGLRCLVFIRSENGLDRLFLGLASPEQVRRALAADSVWLEPDLAAAYAEVLAPKNRDSPEPVDRRTGVLHQSVASNVVVKFMDRLQAKPDDATEDEWVRLPRKGSDPERWERARWIKPTELTTLLPFGLDESAYVMHSLRASRRELAHAVLRGTGEFVALIDERFRFTGLADRRVLLEQAAATVYPD